MSHSASADHSTFAHHELRNAVVSAPPADDEPKPSKHKRIGRHGLTAAVCAAVVFVALGGAAAGGMSDDLPRELWSWIRATLITLIVIGLVVAGFGYGVEGANKREERSRAAMELLATVLRRELEEHREEIEVVREKVDAHGHNVFVDHTELHRENVRNEERIGQIIEAVARMLAFQEQSSHLFTECREHIGDLRQQVADLSLDYGKQLEELKESLSQVGADLGSERLEAIVVEAIRKAYTNGYIDALDGRPPNGGNVRRLPGPDQR